MRRSLLMALALLAWTAPARANLVTLVFTLPSQNATVIDTTYFDCGGGPPLTDLASVELWGWWQGPGSVPKKLLDHAVITREGQVDSFTVDASWGYHFWIVTKDFAQNKSCASNVVYACSPCSITGVPVGAPTRRSVTDAWFDVRGRAITKLPSSGIVFHAWRIDGRLQKPAQRVPLRDGVPLISLSPPR